MSVTMLPINTISSLLFATVGNAVIIKYNETCLFPENGETVSKQCPTDPDFKPDFIYNSETNMISRTKENWAEKKCWSLEKPQVYSEKPTLKIKFKSCEQWKHLDQSVTRKNFIYTDKQIKVGIAPGYCVDLTNILPNLVFADKCDRNENTVPEIPTDLTDVIDTLIEKHVQNMKEIIIFNQTENLVFTRSQLEKHFDLSFSSFRNEISNKFGEMKSDVERQIEGMKEELKTLDGVHGLLSLVCENQNGYSWNGAGKFCDCEEGFENEGKGEKLMCVEIFSTTEPTTEVTTETGSGAGLRRGSEFPT